MKSEHRHELQTNDLGKLMAQAEPFMEKYGMKIAVAVGVALVLVIGYFAWSASATSQNAEGWTRLAACASTADYENVAEDFAGTEVAEWALVNAAESHLQSGIRNMFTDRKAGNRELEDAKEQFQQLLDSSSTIPAIRERALFGLARTEESTSDGDLKNATELYKKLIQEFPDSIFRKLAEQRVKPVKGEKVAVLENENTQKFYKWFHAQDPKPGDRQRPGFNLPMPGTSPGSGGNTKNDSSGLPKLPPLNIPGLPEPLTSESDEKKSPDSTTPAKEEPESADKPATPKDTDKPAGSSQEKPKSEPATEKKP